jgi:hypothetical protein
MTVTCSGCGASWPRNPAIEVECAALLDRIIGQQSQIVA